MGVASCPDGRPGSERRREKVQGGTLGHPMFRGLEDKEEIEKKPQVIAREQRAEGVGSVGGPVTTQAFAGWEDVKRIRWRKRLDGTVWMEWEEEARDLNGLGREGRREPGSRQLWTLKRKFL